MGPGNVRACEGGGGGRRDASTSIHHLGVHGDVADGDVRRTHPLVTLAQLTQTYFIAEAQ